MLTSLLRAWRRRRLQTVCVGTRLCHPWPWAGAPAAGPGGRAGAGWRSERSLCVSPLPSRAPGQADLRPHSGAGSLASVAGVGEESLGVRPSVRRALLPLAKRSVCRGDISCFHWFTAFVDCVWVIWCLKRCTILWEGRTVGTREK